MSGRPRYSTFIEDMLGSTLVHVCVRSQLEEEIEAIDQKKNLDHVSATECKVPSRSDTQCSSAAEFQHGFICLAHILKGSMKSSLWHN